MRAPAQDPEGNRSLIKFGRKTKEHFVMTEVDDKPTGWRADFVDGKWVEEAAPVRKPKAKAKAKPKGKAKAKAKAKPKAKVAARKTPAKTDPEPSLVSED